jgi:hypothetical protein
MDTISAFGFEACCTAIVGDMAKALSERNGETPEQQFARAQAAVHLILGFLPRDVTEALLASHCVMFHELMVGGVHDTLCAQEGKARRAELHGLMAMNKAFCGNLDHLRHYQKRPAEGSREAPAGTEPTLPPVPAAVEEPTVPVAAQAAASDVPEQMVAMPSSSADQTGPESMPSALGKFAAVYRPAAAAIAASRGNPAAAAALKAGDAVGFARAMGIEQPSAAFLAAANAAGSPFDRKAAGPWPASAQDKPKA